MEENCSRNISSGTSPSRNFSAIVSDSSSILWPSTCRRFNRVPGCIAAENFSSFAFCSWHCSASFCSFWYLSERFVRPVSNGVWNSRFCSARLRFVAKAISLSSCSSWTSVDSSARRWISSEFSCSSWSSFTDRSLNVSIFTGECEFL